MTCTGCRDGAAFPTDFSIAFQPIVNVRTGTIFAHEALVRGPSGEGAMTVLSTVTDANRYAFDQQCRVRAIEHAARLGLGRDGAMLSINFLPNAVYEPSACIRLTLATARQTGFPLDQLMFEFTESEQVAPDHLDRILRAYRALGFSTAIDDFGAGHAGLGLLADFQTDVIKLDMHLVRGIDGSAARRAIVAGVVGMCRELDITCVAEGIEIAAERDTLIDLGVLLQQGYLFARPAFEALAVPVCVESLASAAA